MLGQAFHGELHLNAGAYQKRYMIGSIAGSKKSSKGSM